MADLKQIHDFAIKWMEKFREPNIDYIELVDHYLADDCTALGFEMDCGQSFCKRYGHNPDMNYVDDIQVLGSAIYSQWRYFNHWAYDAEEILEPENRSWFITALNRLAVLSGEKPMVFQGVPKRIFLSSNNVGYGIVPEPDEVVTQNLTIEADGTASVITFTFGTIASRIIEIGIDQDTAAKLISTIASYFSVEYDEKFYTDVGGWELEITNTDDVTYEFKGSLCTDFDGELSSLSDMLRNVLHMPELFAFDGNSAPDVINRITVDYCRIEKYEDEPEEIEYSEKLTVEREKGYIEYVQNYASGRKALQRYEDKNGVNKLLKTINIPTLFGQVIGNPEDVIESENESKDYKITVDFEKSPQAVITGSFDKYGLPSDFAIFAQNIYYLIHRNTRSEMLDSSIYSKAKPRKSDYMYCSVEFENGYKSYYYISDDHSIEDGDVVVVPAGKDNHEAIVVVTKIEYFSAEDAPIPVEKTKHIIRKYDNELLENNRKYKES